MYCADCGTVPVPEEDLPVVLPDVADFRPTGTGVSPLATVESFVHTDCPSCDGPARRETDVSDTFLDSAWYFLRYPSSDVHDRPGIRSGPRGCCPSTRTRAGPEHVVRHHLYARFVTHALYDLGLVPFAEPFPHLRLHGMLTKDGAKMSKSRGNVVNPDRYVADHGADVTRMYLLFIGPWDEGGDFSDAGIAGHRTVPSARLAPRDRASLPGLGAVWIFARWTGPSRRSARDLEEMRFNTAIASLMELVRWARRERARHVRARNGRGSQRAIVLLLAPFAPHLAEELWSRIGGDYSVHRQPWPVLRPGLACAPTK